MDITRGAPRRTAELARACAFERCFAASGRRARVKLIGIPFRVDWRWSLGAVAIFITEVFIGLRIHDRWVRPHGGDVLVVALIHAVVRATTAWPWRRVLAGTLLFALGVEGLQAMHLVRRLHLQGSRLWSTVLGTSADASDLASYLIGGALVAAFEVAVERRRRRRERPPASA